MALYVLPFDSLDTNYQVDVALAGRVYRFRLYYNNRAGLWTMDVCTSQDDVIVAGVVLLSDWELLGHFPDLRLPPGPLYCVDTSGRSEDPGPDELGGRVIVVFDDGA